MAEQEQSIRRLIQRIDEVLSALELAERAAASDAFNAIGVHQELSTAVGSLGDAIDETMADGPIAGFTEILRSVSHSVRELRMLGAAPDSRLSPLTHRRILKAIPRRVFENLWDSASQLESTVALQEQHRRDQDAVRRAAEKNVLLDFVRRNPGKGCCRSFPSFTDETQYDQEGLPQSYIAVEVFEYAENIWIVARTSHHMEAPELSSTEYEQITPTEGARLLLASELELNIDDLIWLKELACAAQVPNAAPEIKWDLTKRKLTINGVVARNVAVNATRVIPLFDAFQASSWAERIANPFPNDVVSEVLRAAIRTANKRCKGIRFEADGSGGVQYRLTTALDNGT